MKILSRTRVTAGVTTGPPLQVRSWHRHRVLAGLVATGVAGTSLLNPGLAAAAPPSFPNNIVVFPDRDFVTIEGYQDRIGQEALVKRGGSVIGSAKAKVEDGGDPAGVAFEINHPGGACWGAGTDHQVTPDILPGDVVAISFNGVPAGDTTVADTYVTGSSLGADGTTLTITGHIGAGVNKTQLEQRIVNPDLTGTDVNRRDARAVPGGPAPAPKGGYTSNLVVDDQTFTATYLFTLAATAKIAADGGGERMMSWQVEDAAANRQGLTIAERGELGGPGMGGCPAGAKQVGPVGPTNVTAVRSSDKTSVKLGWTPAATVPGTAAITGYRATAVETVATNNEKVEFGKRIDGVSATGTTIAGLNPAKDYAFEVRSVSPVGETFPASVPGAGGTSTNGSTNADVTPPTVSATVSGTNITFSSNEPTASIYYTTGPAPGVDVFTGGGSTLATTATLFKAGTPVRVPTQGTVLKFAAVDQADNVSDPSTGTVFGGDSTSTPLPTPGAVTGLTATAEQGAVDLAWASSDASITGYTVKTYDVATGGLPVGTPIETTTRTATVTGLTTNKDYWFTVTPKNANGAGADSARVSAKPTAVTDTVTVSRATYKTNDFRVVGTSTATGGTVSVYRVDPRLPVNASAQPIAGMANQPLVAAATPATGTTFDIRLRNTNNIPQPATVWVRSSNGGVGQLAVRNG